MWGRLLLQRWTDKQDREALDRRILDSYADHGEAATARLLNVSTEQVKTALRRNPGEGTPFMRAAGRRDNG